MAKPADKLTPADFQEHPVWTFDLGNEGIVGRDETFMIPVTILPVHSLSNCGCLANAALACGQKLCAVLWSVDLGSLRHTEQFIQISVWLKDNWWRLELPEEGFSSTNHLPTDLASNLGLQLDEVFPISYDISEFAMGPDQIIKGHIFTERFEKLTMSERIALALDKAK